MKYYNTRFGFTLAEVLITLGIIGVLAAITIGVLVNKYTNLQYVAQLKKSYTVLSQAIQFVQRDFGDIESWNWDRDTEAFLNNYFKPYFPGSKVYPPLDWKRSMCYEQDIGFEVSGSKYQYNWLNGVWISTPFGNITSSIRLSNGICIGTIGYSGSTWSRMLAVDTNGSAKGPNTAGKDLFFFIIDNNTKLVPYGIDLSLEELSSLYRNACNKNAASPGFTCAASIMKEGWQIKY